MSESFIESSWVQKDPPFDTPLRPKTLSSFIGQELLKTRLAIFIKAAKQRKEPLGHALFHGPPGLGKTTLSNILSEEMESHMISSSGPALEKPADLVGILTNLEEGDVFFVDEIHRLNRTVEEYLYSAMEDFSLDIMIDSGPSSRSVQVKIKPFTLVGATTRSGLVSSPMRSRFAITCRLEFYPFETLAKILERTASIFNITLALDAGFEIAKRSRGTPRIANHLLRWVRDYAQIHKQPQITTKIVCQALDMLAIDHLGLDEMDKKLLATIIDHHQGGPVGLNTLAIALSEDPTTLSEVYEPYLILKGLLRHTSRGREATQLAYEHLGKEKK